MTHDSISNWVEAAKAAVDGETKTAGIKVIRRETPRGKGAIVMDIAERLMPWLSKTLEGVRDRKGMLVHPATVRAIALNVAQDILNEQEAKKASA